MIGSSGEVKLRKRTPDRWDFSYGGDDDDDEVVVCVSMRHSFVLD